MSVTEFADLPFVKAVGEDRQIQSTWNVDEKRSGDYTKDCALGRSFCHSLFMVINTSGNRMFLSRVLQGQVAGGKWEAIEVGFAQALTDEVMM